MGKVTRHQNFVHKGLSAPAPGLYTCGKTFKNVYKIRIKREIFLKLATNGRSGKGFLLTSKVCPQGVFCPCPGAIYMYKVIKNVYKIRFRRDHFEICNIRAFCWHQHLSPSGCLPLPRAIYMYKSIKIYTRTRCQVSAYRITCPLVRCDNLDFSWHTYFCCNKRAEKWP